MTNIPGSYNTPGADTNKIRNIVIGVTAAAIAVAALVALVISSESGLKAPESAQETSLVYIEGDRLPTYNAATVDEAIGMPAPTLRAENFAAEPASIVPGDGNAHIIVFGAHWCPHCQKEVPQIADWLSDEPLPEGVDITLVSTSATQGQSQWPPSRWVHRTGWAHQVLLDDDTGSAAEFYGVSGFPYLVFLNADGTVAGRHSGAIDHDNFYAIAEHLADTAHNTSGGDTSDTQDSDTQDSGASDSATPDGDTAAGD